MLTFLETLFYNPVRDIFFFFMDYTGGVLAISILLLVVFVRLILLPLYISFFSTQNKLQKVKPLLKKIQKRYKNDRQKMSLEIMGVYKEHDIKIRYIFMFFFIQIPIYLILFFVIQDWGMWGTNTEIITDFLFFDLQDKGNYLLAATVGVTQFIVLRLSQRKTEDEKGAIIQKYMLYILPPLVVGVSLFVGNDVAWYLLIMNCFSVFQELGVLLYRRGFQLKSP